MPRFFYGPRSVNQGSKIRVSSTCQRRRSPRLCTVGIITGAKQAGFQAAWAIDSTKEWDYANLTSSGPECCGEWCMFLLKGGKILRQTEAASDLWSTIGNCRNFGGILNNATGRQNA